MFEESKRAQKKLVGQLDEAIAELKLVNRELSHTKGIYAEKVIPVIEDKIRDFGRVKDDLLALL